MIQFHFGSKPFMEFYAYIYGFGYYLETISRYCKIIFIVLILFFVLS